MPEGGERRTFLKLVAGGLYAILLGFVLAPIGRFLAASMGRSRSAPEFLRVAPLSSLPVNRPHRVVIHRDRWDAFTHYPPGPIGTVWLLRGEGNGGAEVLCLQSICPHLGCGIDFAASRDVFVCPCHASDFEATGRRLTGPSPRDMDELPCRITGPDQSGKRWVEVQYEEFRIGSVARQRIA